MTDEIVNGCPEPDMEKVKKTDPVPLCLVAQKIKKALEDYNADPEIDKTLLPLVSAEFDFKVVRSTSAGFKINFLIFTLGTTRQVDSTDQITFSYEVPKKTAMAFADMKKSPDFSAQLIQTIRDAAEQVKATQTVGAAKFKTLTVNLAYAVKWDFTAGLSVPIQLVTAGASFDRNKTSTQSVKLTFGQKG